MAWAEQHYFFFYNTLLEAYTRNLEGIKPIKAKEGTAKDRTCPESLGVKIPKNSPFQSLNHW
jgi:hypothetical protein